MNTLPFVKNLFFKRDANNELTVNVPVTLIVFFALSVGCLFIGNLIANFFYIEFEIPLSCWYIVFGIFTSALAYVLISAIGENKDVISLINEQNRLQYSIILLVAVTAIFILLDIAAGVFYFDIVMNIIFPLIIGSISAGLMYFILGKLLNVEPLPQYVGKRNHYLAFIIGYIGAFYTSLLGIIFGIYLYTRSDNEYAKIYGIFLIGFSILMWIVSFYLSSIGLNSFYY